MATYAQLPLHLVLELEQVELIEHTYGLVHLHVDAGAHAARAVQKEIEQVADMVGVVDAQLVKFVRAWVEWLASIAIRATSRGRGMSVATMLSRRSVIDIELAIVWVVDSIQIVRHDEPLAEASVAFGEQWALDEIVQRLEQHWAALVGQAVVGGGGVRENVLAIRAAARWCGRRGTRGVRRLIGLQVARDKRAQVSRLLFLEPEYPQLFAILWLSTWLACIFFNRR